jgi:HK97 family phage prohead protease
MPWVAADADRHVDGLSARQRRVWARVANGALSRCLTSGGSQSACEGRAIRQANAVAQRIPKKGLPFGLAHAKNWAGAPDDTSFKLDTESPGYVEAAFSIFGKIDSDRDIVEPTAFKNGQPIPLVWSHDWQRPVGKGAVNVEKDRAVFKGRFFLNTTAGRDAYETVKEMGDLQQWSWGFRVTDATMDTVDGENIRRIKSADVFEVSPVLVGANRETHTVAIKSGDVSDDGDEIDDAALAQILDAVERDEEKAAWDAAYINDLPDSAFAVILPGGEKDGEGKTTPRNLRKLPHHNADGSLDMPHLRNALARLEQADLPDDAKGTARGHLEKHAKAEGVGDRGKAYDPDPAEKAAGLTMEEEADVALVAAEGFTSRLADLVSLRQSEGKIGRAISANRLQRLTTLEEALRSAANHIRDLVAEATPKPDSEDEDEAGDKPKKPAASGGDPKKADPALRLRQLRLETERIRTAALSNTR